jgi:hypothetical protein
VWTVQLEHTSGGPVTSASLQKLAVAVSGTTACTAPPKVLSSVPIAFGRFVAGKATATVTFDFSGCPAAARFTVDAAIETNGSTVNQKWQNQFR